MRASMHSNLLPLTLDNHPCCRRSDGDRIFCPLAAMESNLEDQGAPQHSATSLQMDNVPHQVPCTGLPISGVHS